MRKSKLDVIEKIYVDENTEGTVTVVVQRNPADGDPNAAGASNVREIDLTGALGGGDVAKLFVSSQLGDPNDPNRIALQCRALTGPIIGYDLWSDIIIAEPAADPNFSSIILDYWSDPNDGRIQTRTLRKLVITHGTDPNQSILVNGNILEQVYMEFSCDGDLEIDGNAPVITLIDGIGPDAPIHR